ncbi:hypothetical protein [Deinococcus roseus]|uniref:Uncharacterized protein n=1 Tax=Deinococcus roseus TaxID=392414 RepID=A0ABQ2CUW5_9DEIO|nr:hypothetical protein [Deinococcus roseus]GGJ19506.1 hypothetical protein GCM10008938_02000 [Deinococcus roseus]
MRHIEFEARLRYQELQQEAEALQQLRQVPRIHLLRRVATVLMSLADRLDPPVMAVVARQDCAC